MRGANRGGNLGAVSRTSADGSLATILDTVDRCSSSLRSLAAAVTDAQDQHSSEFFNECKLGIFEAAHSVDQVQAQYVASKHVLKQFQERSDDTAHTSSSAIMVDDGAIISKRLKAEIAENMQSADASINNTKAKKSSDLIRDLEELFESEPNQEEGSDEDIQAVNTGPTEQDFKCPVLLKVMSVALKKLVY